MSRRWWVTVKVAGFQDPFLKSFKTAEDQSDFVGDLLRVLDEPGQTIELRSVYPGIQDWHVQGSAIQAYSLHAPVSGPLEE